MRRESLPWALRVFRWVREECAQSFAETALMLPIMVFLLVGGADISRAYAIWLAVQNGARAGAEASATVAMPTPAEAKAHAVQEIQRTPGIDVNEPPLHVDMWISSVPGAQSPACTVIPPTMNNPCWATVHVTYTFNTIVSWPLLPHTFTFDRWTAFRRFS